jgi:hypothetical protein
MCETSRLIRRGEVQLKPQAEPHLTSWNDFCRLVLKSIAESPCSEPELFIAAAYRGLQRFGDGSLGDLSKLLGQCVQELQARGLVEINGEQLVITPAGSAEEDILDLTAELELQPSLRPSKLDQAPTNQKQLQTQAHVTGGPKRAPKSTREEIIATPAGSAEEDILDLTAELELQPSLRPSKLDQAPTNQKQLQTQAHVTGGPKRAPEPTREEIIAAMRRFISDD